MNKANKAKTKLSVYGFTSFTSLLDQRCPSHPNVDLHCGTFMYSLVHFAWLRKHAYIRSPKYYNFNFSLAVGNFMQHRSAGPAFTSHHYLMLPPCWSSNDGLLFRIRAGKYDAGPGKVDHRDKGVEHLLHGQFTTRPRVSTMDSSEHASAGSCFSTWGHSREAADQLCLQPRPPELQWMWLKGEIGWS